MNYRHAYHAGNHADVLKHIVLARLIVHLQKKETPFRVLDAHGGVGVYDLGGVEAGKTLEWRDGAGRLYDANGNALPLSAEAEALMAPWRTSVDAVNEKGAFARYPGSPEIARALLRKDDRLRFNELHPADYQTLASRYAADRRAAVSNLDALAFVKSQLPPPERRGIVLIDPPYEKADEAAQAIRMVSEGLKRFATGVFCLWLPITGDGLDRRLWEDATMLGVNLLRAQLTVRPVRPDGGLAGSAVIVINPPWRLDEELRALLPPLAERLSQGAPGFRVDAGPV